MAVVRDNNKWNADTLAELQALGSDDGVTTDVVAWAVDNNNWYYPATISATTSTWTPLATGGGTTRIAQDGVITNNLQFFIDFNNQSSWVPNQTTTWTDTIGDVAGTTGGTVTITDGHFNFNGTDTDVDFGTLTTALEDIFAGGGTLVAWMRPETAGETGFGRVMETTDSGAEGWAFYTRDDVSTPAGQVRVNLGANTTGTSWQWYSSPFDLNEWVMVTVSYDTASLSTAPVFTVNTATAAGGNFTGSGTYVSDAGNLLIVGNRSAGDRTFDGDIEMVMLFDRTLSTAEITDIYNTTKGRFGFVTASSWADTLSAGNTSGGTDAVMTSGDALRGEDGSAGGALTVRAGDATATVGGALTVRAGDTSAVDDAGALTLRAGDAPSAGTADAAGAVLLRAGDVGGTGFGGAIVVRGGNKTGTGTGQAGTALFRSGQEANGESGQMWVTTSGDEVSPVGTTTGPLFIGTAQSTPGNTPIDNPSTPTYVAVAGTSGAIDIRTGSTNSTTGAKAGDITITAGDWTGGDAFFGDTPGSITLTAGDTNGKSAGGGGDVTITAGARTSTVSNAGSGGGVVSITAGDSGNSDAGSPGGAVTLTAGSATGTNGYGGDITLSAGAGTGTGDAGNIVLTPGTGGAGGGEITLDYATWPTADGSSGQVLQTNGAGTLSWAPGGVTNLQEAYEGGNTIVTDATNGLLDVSGTQAISLDAGGASNFTVAGAALTLSTTTSGDVVASAAGNVDVDGTNVLVDATSAISLDGAAASNFTVAGADLTLSTTTSGELDLTSAGLMDVNAGANLDIDVTGTFDMLSTGAFSIDGTGASNVTATSGALTLSTTTSGNVVLTPADSLILDYATWPAADGTNGQVLSTNGAGALSWTDGTAGSAWSEETAQTTDATAGVTIATPIATVTDGTQHSVEVLITAESGGSNTYFRRQIFTFYRDGGGAVQWTTEINGTEARRGLTTATASLSVSGNSVLVTATGEAATTINWKVQYRTTNTITNGGTVSTTGIVRETLDSRGSALTTGSAAGSGGTVDFTIAAGAAYVSMQFLRVITASGTCNDATIQFFRDAARTDEIYDAENKDTGTGNGWVDRNTATMVGDDGTGLASNTMYGRITNNDAASATFDVEVVLWGVT